eukprot:m.175474 g.175474  ORF g.175474 m.175474 type:complete len:667 (-) comp17349_c2_seq1:376-2376(-)
MAILSSPTDGRLFTMPPSTTGAAPAAGLGSNGGAAMTGAGFSAGGSSSSGLLDLGHGQGATDGSALDDIIARVGSSNPAVAIQALKMAEDLAKDSSHLVLPNVDQLVTACALQLRLTFTVHLGSGGGNAGRVSAADAVRLSKHLLSCVMHVFSSPALARGISPPALQELVADLMTRVLDERLETLEEGPQIVRALNMIVAKALENCDRNAVFQFLLRILRDAVGENSTLLANAKFVELVMKCLWKVTKAIPTTIGELNVGALLLEIHGFLRAHPPAAWKQRKDDTPLRTVKTIIHSLVKALDIEVLPYLTEVGPSPLDTAVGAYLMLMLEKAGHSPDSLEQALHRKPRVASAPPSSQQGMSTPSTSAAAASRLGSLSARPSATTTISSSTPSVASRAAAAGSHFGFHAGSASRLATPTRPFTSSGSSGATMTHAASTASVTTASHTTTGDENGPRSPERGSGASVALTAAEADAALAQIFARITAKETTKEGIQELFDFRTRHPEADLGPHMRRLSPFMSNHVQRRLEQLEQGKVSPQRGMPGTPRIAQTPGASSTSAAASAAGLSTVTKSGSAMAYLERLRALTSQTGAGAGGAGAGAGGEQPSQHAPIPLVFDAPPSSDVLPEVSGMRSPLQRKPENQAASSNTAASLDSIKARLARMKKQSAA